MKSACDYSTKAQECSGIRDRELHPPTSPVGSPAAHINTELPLSMSQPAGVMLLNALTGKLHAYSLVFASLAA